MKEVSKNRISNIKLCQDYFLADSESHTMNDSLEKYLEMKIHHLTYKFDFKSVIIVGEYSPASNISNNEKGGKIFNKRRPTAHIHNKTLFVKCFPGHDYVRHYASIYASFFLIKKKDIRVYYIPPSAEECDIAINNTNLSEIGGKGYNTAIIGMVENFSTKFRQSCRFESKEKSGDFQFSPTMFSNTVLIGCKFSFWGDIAGRIIKKLYESGINNIIYIGKLGTLDPNIAPNQYLATGSESLFSNKNIKWNGIFDDINHLKLIHGNHITSPSILEETTDWLKKNNQFRFVDPEIGNMASVAIENNIIFSYLHIISDNLSKKYVEDLSNERSINAQQKRANLMSDIEQIVTNKLKQNERNRSQV